MSRPKSPKRKVRSLDQILEAHELLFRALYKGVELSGEAEGMLMALAWVLGVPGNGDMFEASLARVREGLRTVSVAWAANAREAPQGET